MVTQDTCGFMVFCEPQKIRPWSRGTGERRTSYNPERVLYLDVYSATVRIQPRAGLERVLHLERVRTLQCKHGALRSVRRSYLQPCYASDSWAQGAESTRGIGTR